MPVDCSVDIEQLSTEEFGDLDFKVMRFAFDTHNALGRLADERIYQADLAERLKSFGMQVLRELAVVLSFEGFRKSLYLDLVVGRKGVYELKAIKAISDAHITQLLTYLYLLDLPRGKLLNFGGPKVESQFVNAPIPSSRRKGFSVDDQGYDGPEQFKELCIRLLRDWGTSLNLSLYLEALISIFGGLEKVEVMLPLCRDGVCLGNQRFHLATANSAFNLTSMSRSSSAYEVQLSRLLRYSPLEAIHWVNIGHENVVFKTVGR